MSERPGGPPFIDHMPQSVIDRFEAKQAKTASQHPPHVDWTRDIRDKACAKPCMDPTHYICDQDTGATHHLVPRPAGMTCRGCGKTEKQIRNSISQVD